MGRKIISISVTHVKGEQTYRDETTIYALCEDGSIWSRSAKWEDTRSDWTLFPVPMIPEKRKIKIDDGLGDIDDQRG